MGVALRDLANGTDNAKALRDDWDRRNNPKGESQADYAKRSKEQAKANQDQFNAQAFSDLQRTVERLADETAYTNDLLHMQRR